MNEKEVASLRQARAYLELAAVAIEGALGEGEDHAVPSGEGEECQHPREKRVAVPTSGHPDAFICNACGTEVG